METSPRPQNPAQIRAEVDQMLARIEGLDHFQLLSIERDADFSQLKAAYVRLAKRWHLDAFAGIDLEGRASSVDAIFKRINEAYAVLSDPDLRNEYVVRLQRSKAGLSNDVQAVLQGEACIDEGLAHLARKRWDAAELAFERAENLNKDDPFIWVHLAYARYRSQRGGPAGLPALKTQVERALAVQENLPEAYLFLGQAYFEANELAHARKWLDRCLQRDSTNIEATRLLRLVHSRAQKKQKKANGLLDWAKKLLGD